MKILTVVGARPQFIKAAPVSKTLRESGAQEILVHTGQHYDVSMSRIFFEELALPEPDVNLEVGSGPHGWQTGQMLLRIEEVLLAEKPDRVVVYGDTNSTLAGALAASKLHVPLTHVEAGLRSFNRAMPEEINRVLTDHCSDVLCCPTQTAVDNLAQEGIRQGTYLVGDTMYDAVLQFASLANQRTALLRNLGLSPKGYLLATVHRPYNTDVPENLHSILTAFLESGEPVVFPVHPRTQPKLEALFGPFNGGRTLGKVHMIKPVGYLDMLMLEQHARLILTDSGGIQKEAYFFGVPCITLRPETEWVETVQEGWNVIVHANKEQIVHYITRHHWPNCSPPAVFGDGNAALRIVNILACSSLPTKDVVPHY